MSNSQQGVLSGQNESSEGVPVFGRKATIGAIGQGYFGNPQTVQQFTSSLTAEHSCNPATVLWLGCNGDKPGTMESRSANHHYE